MLSERLLKLRYWAVAISLMILVYCNLYLWLFIPYAPYDFNWRPDHVMQIVAVKQGSDAAAQLKASDQLLAVDGLPMLRASAFFLPTTRHTEHTMSIQRDGEVLDVVVPFLDAPDANAIALRAVGGVLSLIFWAAGALVLHYAWWNNQQAIWLGYIFLLTAVVVISWNSTLMGVPYTWITSQPLLFATAVAWIYLGFLPMYAPFSRKNRLLLLILLSLAITLGILGLVEGLVLFPKGTSIQGVTGISLYKMCAASLVLAGMFMFGLLAGRRITTQNSYLRQQLSILLVFVTLGVVPAVFLTFLPLAAWDTPILSVPLAMVGLIAVPIGYLYAILRHGYLDLDNKFGRAIPYVLLVLFFSTVYSLSLRTLDELYGDELNLVLPAVLLFVLMAILMPRISTWVELHLHDLFFGRVLATPTKMNAFALNLAHQPDLDNLERVVKEMCELLRVSAATLLVKNGNEMLKANVYVGNPTFLERASNAWVLDRTIVRTVQQREGNLHPLFVALPWAEVALPLRMRDQTFGLWVLARPHDGFYTQETITFLEHAASTLAMGSEIIVLLDSAETLSREIIGVQEEERRAFASQLHDQPLQRLAAARMMLGHIIANMDAKDVATFTRMEDLSGDLAVLDTELRNVYDAAFPKVIEYGIDTTLHALADQFRFDHDLDILITVDNLTAAEYGGDARLGRVIYRIVLEALNNVVKHSGASVVQISACCHDGFLTIIIADNGREQPQTTLPTSQLLRERHFGIAGMRAWAKSIEGRLTIASDSDGTQVAFSAPLKIIT